MRRADFLARQFANGTVVRGKYDRIRCLNIGDGYGAFWRFKNRPIAIWFRYSYRNIYILRLNDCGDHSASTMARISAVISHFQVGVLTPKEGKRKKFLFMKKGENELTLWLGQMEFSLSKEINFNPYHCQYSVKDRFLWPLGHYSDFALETEWLTNDTRIGDLPCTN